MFSKSSSFLGKLYGYDNLHVKYGMTSLLNRDSLTAFTVIGRTFSKAWVLSGKDVSIFLQSSCYMGTSKCLYYRIAKIKNIKSILICNL